VQVTLRQSIQLIPADILVLVEGVEESKIANTKRFSKQSFQ
jgi:hypothetical protein